MRLKELVELASDALAYHGDIAVGCWLNDIDGDLHQEDPETSREPDPQVRSWNNDGVILDAGDTREIGKVFML